ncbi:hypothetical protein GQ85_18225 [Rhodococcus rhodochrous]|nr:hypothetical protein GQ85_18225 [Rhodococcus rhodochrous]
MPEIENKPVETETVEAPKGTVEPEAKKPESTETVEHWKAIAREQEKRAKANVAAAKRLAEIEEANKTAEEKANERIAAAEQRAQELELKATRGEISGSTGVPADILVGPEDATAEAIQAYADKLLAWRGNTAAPERPPVGVHVPNEGNVPSGASLDEQIAAASRPGTTLSQST